MWSSLRTSLSVIQPTSRAVVQKLIARPTKSRTTSTRGPPCCTTVAKKLFKSLGGLRATGQLNLVRAVQMVLVLVGNRPHPCQEGLLARK